MPLLSPKIDARSFRQLLQQVQAMAPFYVPEWNAQQDGDPGLALIKIYLNMHEQVIDRLNEAPYKNFVAFLDMLGIKMQPAQSATVPLTFTLTEGTAEHVLVQKGTEVSGPVTKDDEQVEAVFRTKENVLVSPAILEELFSVQPVTDEIFAHTAEFNSGVPFIFWKENDEQEHSLYLGHESLFNQSRPSEIRVTFVLTSGVRGEGELKFVWEYWNGRNWVTLASLADPELDFTRKFQKNGDMILRKTHSGEIALLELLPEKESRWIRCRIIDTPLSAVSAVTLPVIDTIRLSVSPLHPFGADLAFNNDIPLDVAEIKATMLAKEPKVPLAFDFDQHVLQPEGANVYLRDVSELQEGDWLEFDNTFDYKEIAVITEEPNNSEKRISLRHPTDPASPPLQLRYEKDKGAKVRLITAIRGDEETLDVKPMIGSERIVGGKVIFPQNGAESDVAYVESFTNMPEAEEAESKTRLTLRSSDSGNGNGPTLKRLYIEDEQAVILPKTLPFGELPILFDTFYLASDEAFSKKGAKITVEIESHWNAATQNDCGKVDVLLSWEYWNGKSWRGIRVTDTTNRFCGTGAIRFTCPTDIAPVEVNGEEKFWIRSRIIDGDYGTELIIRPKKSGSTEVEIVSGTVHFPIITELKIAYEGIEKEPDFCMTRNNLNFRDRSDACRQTDQSFLPFEALEENLPGLFLGFTEALKNAPIRILFDVVEQALSEDDRLNVLWFYWDGQDWSPITVSDETEHLTRIGILTMNFGRDFAKREWFGKELFWIKGVVAEGEHPQPPQVRGIFPNSVDSFQASAISDEVLGSSDGTANQKFTLLNPPVISQEVLVREPDELPDEEDAIRAEEGEDAVIRELDDAGELKAIWVRWHEVEDFDASDANSRHYLMNKRLGSLQFGDGEKGMVPPPGTDNMKVNYIFGGGKIGNVASGIISELKNAIPFVDSVVNHLPADGGAETETLDEVLLRGPQRLKHRDRAVSSTDFEWLTKSISRKVARAKCLPNMDENGEPTPGWVTVIVLPDSDDKKPTPTTELIKKIEKGLAAASVNTVAAPAHIHVRGADFAEITVEVTVVPVDFDAAAQLENRVRKQLEQFLHPLKGGPANTGWEFGKIVCFSDLYALIERIEQVDYVAAVAVLKNGARQAGDVQLAENTLPVSGEHVITIKLPTQKTLPQPIRESECAEL